ncbi:MAG: Ig-like domain-containing protein [Clostridia bacterium]|nr:Ig-like domain-containing protein [Clostridia bacterium]
MFKKRLTSVWLAVLITACFIFSGNTGAAAVCSGDSLPVLADDKPLEPEYALPEPDYPEIIADKAGDHAARLYYKEEMNTLVYINDDGTETLYMFGMDVKYTDENGEIKDKSTNLALSEEGYYNPDNDIIVTFAKDLENGIGVTYNDIVISVRPEELKESVKQAELQRIALPEEDERERVVYADAFEKADIVYTPTFDGFKEDIVVNEYNGVTEYVFMAFTENARIEGHDIFRGEERIGDIGAIYVLDSEGECTYGVLEAEETEPGEYILTVSVDAEFLENAAYPVYIDPSVTIYSYSSGPKLIEDAPVYSNSSSAYGTNKYNYCGYVSSSLGYGRVLYRMPGITSDYTYNQISASQITSVILHLREASGKSGSATVTARPFLETWTESGVKFSNVNVNNYNSSGTYAASKTYSSSPNWWEFEIKETVKAWKNGTFTASYGIILINSNESSSTYYRNFLSTEYTNSNYYPYITMDYTPSIVVTPSTKTMYVGETFQLSASTYPSGISYTWFSMDSSIATVDGTGEVTAVAPGTTYIVANGGSNGSGTCVVTVLPIGVSLNYYSKTIAIGDSFQLSASTIPVGDTIDFTVTQSGNIVSLSGMGSSVGVTGLSIGTATVTATTSRGATASCTVTVTPRFNISQTSLVLGLDDFETLTADCAPAPDSTHPVTWSITGGSSHIDIDPVGAKCTVTPLTIGTATITATYRGITRTINVEVRVLRDGVYYIESKEYSMYLQIDDDEGPNYSTENAITEVWPFDGNNYQRWQITHRGNGYYSIISPISGKVLSIDADELYSTDESVILQTYQGLDRQLWKITKNASGSFKIKAKSSEPYTDDDLVMAVGSPNIFGPEGTDVEQRLFYIDDDYKDEWLFIRYIGTLNYWNSDSNIIAYWPTSPLIYTECDSTKTSSVFCSSFNAGVATATAVWGNALGLDSSTTSLSLADIEIYGLSAAEYEDKTGEPWPVSGVGLTVPDSNPYGIACFGNTIKWIGKYTHAKVYILFIPTASQDEIISTTTHEMGHALGYYGHSPTSTELMFFESNSTNSTIYTLTVNEINHLAQIYELLASP